MSAATDYDNQKPVIFLGFANDREKYLYNLKLEQRGIREAFRLAEEAGLCEVVYENNTTIGDILDVFQKYRDHIAIFHYGGHADDYLLLLESEVGERAPAHSGGLVSFLARQKNLQLIFINGCCSKPQALDLIKAGVPAVVGTSQPIDDAVATEISPRFYKGLASGLAIDRAWNDAVDQIRIEVGDEEFQALNRQGETTGSVVFPWDIYYRDGAEKVKEWNLPAAANNPLFGLPEISPEYYRKLPHTAFIGLQYFKKEEAAIFFGRGAQIRKLYNYITGIHPLILFYGESGVGKSSLLDAGLLPRLENDYTMQYLRRDAKKGLTSSLLEALQNFSDITASAIRNHQSEIGIETWCQIETATGHPLIVILDQVEETFTQPLSGSEESRGELEDFLEIVKRVFDQPGKRPQGKLILSYRKEYHPEIRDSFQKLLLPYAEVFLQQLDRNGIIEAVEGLTKHPATREKYRLEIEKSADGNLAEIIANDLLSDKKSPIAPVLQLVLTKLWDTAVQENPESPRFTVARYQQMQKEGIAMDDFLRQQMEQLRQWKPELVQSGLVLDVLHAHTTALGTAGTCAMDELRQNYNHRQDIFDALIVKCQSLYLLTNIQQNQKLYSRLAHDLLAPVVRSAYHNSDKPGQRAARVLSSKLTDFKADEKNVWLDKADLAAMKKGKNGMRQLTDLEQKLLAISQNLQRRNRISRYAFTTLVIVLIGFVYWANDERTNQESLRMIAEARYENSEWIIAGGYFDAQRNRQGKGIDNKFELQKDSMVVYDDATKLYWQRSGSEESLTYDQTLAYVDSLNRVKFAGFNDWHLPTLKEAMSLMEPEKPWFDKLQWNLYIDSVFEREQSWIWTADVSDNGAWVVYFNYGYCNPSLVGDHSYVRAVRSEDKH